MVKGIGIVSCLALGAIESTGYAVVCFIPCCLVSIIGSIYRGFAEKVFRGIQVDQECTTVLNVLLNCIFICVRLV